MLGGGGAFAAWISTESPGRNGHKDGTLPKADELVSRGDLGGFFPIFPFGEFVILHLRYGTFE